MGSQKNVIKTHAIGIGCSTSAVPNDIVSLILATCSPLPDRFIIATLERRADIVQLVASEFHTRLVVLSLDQLKIATGLMTQSARSAAAASVGSVAEAAALIAAGVGSRLILSRQVGRRCTCALAISA